jgi:hypothetical protein
LQLAKADLKLFVSAQLSDRRVQRFCMIDYNDIMEPGSLWNWFASKTLLCIFISSHCALEISVLNNTLHLVKRGDAYDFDNFSWTKIL